MLGICQLPFHRRYDLIVVVNHRLPFRAVPVIMFHSPYRRP
jgi:hypothetical protein